MLDIAAPEALEPETAFLRNRSQTAVEQKVDALPPHLSLVVKCVALSGMTYAEAASRLDVPIGTIKSRMHEAVRRLRDSLSEEDFL